MTEVTTIGLDLAKRVFQVHGAVAQRDPCGGGKDNEKRGVPRCRRSEPNAAWEGRFNGG